MRRKAPQGGGPRRVVVTLGANSWYGRGVHRMLDAVDALSPRVGFEGWVEGYPDGAPAHEENPYAFKTWVINRAADAGAEVLLWLDAACYPVKPLEEVFEIVEADGYFLCDNGFACGQWCADAALGPLGVTRAEVNAIPEVVTYAVGLDLRRPEIRGLLAEWHRHSLAGTFRGAHANKIALGAMAGWGMAHKSVGAVSDDPAVLGHRHDQTVMSVLAHRRGLTKLWGRPYPVAYYEAGADPDPRTVVLNRGQCET